MPPFGTPTLSAARLSASNVRLPVAEGGVVERLPIRLRVPGIFEVVIDVPVTTEAEVCLHQRCSHGRCSGLLSQKAIASSGLPANVNERASRFAA